MSKERVSNECVVYFSNKIQYTFVKGMCDTINKVGVIIWIITELYFIYDGLKFLIQIPLVW